MTIPDDQKLAALHSRRGTPTQLFAIAGLPRRCSVSVQERLNKESGKNSWFISTAFPAVAGPRIYNRRRSLDALVEQIGSFAFHQRRKRVHESRELAPKRIYLLYVWAADCERLLRAVDFFAYPIPLPHDVNSDAHLDAESTEWRMDPQTAYQTVKAAAQWVNARQRAEEYLRDRITDVAAEHPLRLPPGNFLIGDSRQPISEWFRILRRWGEEWQQLEDELEPVRYGQGDFPGGPLANSSGRCYCDCRGLHFPPDPTRHGPARELPKSADVRRIRRLLNQLYRFGMPLSDGYHHDVQYPKGKRLRDEAMTCSVKGQIRVAGTHANVYPNDFIR